MWKSGYKISDHGVFFQSADKSGQAKKRPANDATGGGAPPPKRPAPPKAPQPKGILTFLYFIILFIIDRVGNRLLLLFLFIVLAVFKNTFISSMVNYNVSLRSS